MNRSERSANGKRIIIIGGGMPAAVTSGKFAIQRICHDEKMKFKSDSAPIL